MLCIIIKKETIERRNFLKRSIGQVTAEWPLFELGKGARTYVEIKVSKRTFGVRTELTDPDHFPLRRAHTLE